MPESRHHDAEAAVRSPAQRTAESQHPSAAPTEAPEIPAPSAELLGDPRLAGRANSPVRTALVQRLSRTLGNRAARQAVQRALAGHGAAILPSVQRDDDVLTAPPPTTDLPFAPAESEAPGTTGPTGAGPTSAGPTPVPTPAPGPGGARAIPADLAAFRAVGPRPADAAGQTIAPSTGMGGFNARYDPVSMALTITVNVAMTFVDGMTLSGDTVTAADASLNKAAARLNALPKAQRLEAVKEWQWSGEQDSFMSAYKASVMGAWSSAGTGLVFQSSHAGWDSQLANTVVVVNTSNATAPAGGAGAAPAATPTHCQAKIFKTPDNNTEFGAAVGPGSAASGTDQTLQLGSGEVGGQSHLLQQRVLFANGSAVLDDKARTRLRKFIVSFQAPPGGAGTTIDLTGHANTVGGGTPEGDAMNLELSQKRAQAVETFLKTEQVNGKNLANAATRIKSDVGVGSAGATDDASFRRVDIVVAGGQGQNIAAHEFGHMIGLDDEYAVEPNGLIKGTGGKVGDATKHDTLARNEGLGGSVAENNDNIMSLGSTVRPPHYATFMEALRTVTGSAEWKMKS